MTAGTGAAAAASYLSALADQVIPATAKGFAACGPVTASELLAAHRGRTPQEAGLALPLAVLHVPALDHNIARMQHWAAERGAELAPHVKTTMAPWIMARQLAAGAWALAVASCGQASVCAALGAPRILIANEVTDPADIAWLAARLREPDGPELLCYADSEAGVDLLAAGLGGQGAARPLGLLIEIGVTGGRGGCRSTGQAVAVARRAAGVPWLAVRGAAGFEGVLADARRPADLARIDDFAGAVHAAGAALAGAGLAGRAGDRVVLSAAGSVFFDRVADRLRQPLPGGGDPLAVLRSGGYVSHDHGHLEHLSPLAGHDGAFLPAIEVRARVLSVPQPDLAIAGAGKREFGTDLGLPVVLGRTGPGGAGLGAAGLIAVAANDQHLHLRRAAGGLDRLLAPGDVVRLGISHPCTTFDRWRLLVALGADGGICDVVHTFF